MTSRLEKCANKNQWYSIYKFLASDEMPEIWNIAELRPNQSAKELADDLANHFVKITNSSPRLLDSDVPNSRSGHGLIPQLDKKMVEDLILKAKKATAEYQGIYPKTCLLYTSPSPRDRQKSRMPSSA